MKVIVAGSGGREHALLWKLSQTSTIKTLCALPGNGGTRAMATPLAAAGSVDELAATLIGERPDLVVVGPEQPLAEGIADRLHAAGIPCFGPTAKAAQIEASKVFSKELMRDAEIPTAAFRVYDRFEDAVKFIKQEPRSQGRVVKTDGLAAGKGAFVCANDDDTLVVLKQLLSEHKLGKAGSRVVIEEKLEGVEASAHYWCDGERFAPLPVARDYKRAAEDDKGPNTGGMGTYCPAMHVTREMMEEVSGRIVAPTLQALAERGAPYSGLLYVGLMLTVDGPQVIEFNCRFGDPETQVMLPVLQGDLLEIMLDCATGSLKSEKISSEPDGAAVCVVLASDGYPGSYVKGIELAGIENSDSQLVFHAGTKLAEGKLVSSGGRVLNAVGLGDSLESAREQAYLLADKLRVPGLRFRRDIAKQIAEAV